MAGATPWRTPITTGSTTPGTSSSVMTGTHVCDPVAAWASRCRAWGWKTAAMLTVGTVVMGVQDLSRAVAFWTQALNYVPKRQITAEDDYMILVPAVGHGAHLALDVSETPPQQHPRVHLDLYAGDAADQASEVQRLVSLGATLVDWDRYPENPDFVVLADPEGNRFCVIDTSS
jgi:predicted enzyme related to lactoylglutathione lyase